MTDSKKHTDDFRIVHIYTTQQAIDDGVLVQPYPERMPGGLLTANVFAACENLVSENRTLAQIIVPLLQDAAMLAMQCALQNPRDTDPHMALANTAVGKVWVRMNDIEGLTIMFPEDY